jgi:hypothetical protein
MADCSHRALVDRSSYFCSLGGYARKGWTHFSGSHGETDNTFVIAVASIFLTVCSAAFVFQLRGVGMKKALLLSIAILCISSLAFAQPGSIGVFADPAGLGCDIFDTAPGLVMVYIIHVYSPGATASQFKVEANHLMTYLAELVTAPYIGIGSSPFGIAIAYGGCFPSPNMILTLQYFASGVSPPCGYVRVVDDPTAIPPGIYVTDCDSPPNLLTATGGSASVNPDPSCNCDIPVEETSWGQIKSLYQ